MSASFVSVLVMAGSIVVLIFGSVIQSPSLSHSEEQMALDDVASEQLTLIECWEDREMMAEKAEQSRKRSSVIDSQDTDCLQSECEGLSSVTLCMECVSILSRIRQDQQRQRSTQKSTGCRTS